MEVLGTFGGGSWKRNKINKEQEIQICRIKMEKKNVSSGKKGNMDSNAI